MNHKSQLVFKVQVKGLPWFFSVGLLSCQQCLFAVDPDVHQLLLQPRHVLASRTHGRSDGQNSFKSIFKIQNKIALKKYFENIK